MVGIEKEMGLVSVAAKRDGYRSTGIDVGCRQGRDPATRPRSRERELRRGGIGAGGGGAAAFLRLPFEFQEKPVVVAHAVIGEPSLRRWSSIAQPLIVYCETIPLAHLRNWTARSLSILNPSATMTSRL